MAKWKPKELQRFYFINCFYGKFSIKLGAFYSGGIRIYHQSGNCFRTKREAEAMLKKIKKLLKEQQ